MCIATYRRCASRYTVDVHRAKKDWGELAKTERRVEKVCRGIVAMISQTGRTHAKKVLRVGEFAGERIAD